jgi:hypothetical protein
MEEEKNNINVELEEGGGSNGLIIGAIIILAIIILGGIYFWDQRTSEKTVNDVNLQGGSNGAATTEIDLNTTDTKNLDAELNAS